MIQEIRGLRNNALEKKRKREEEREGERGREGRKERYNTKGIFGKTERLGFSAEDEGLI